MSIFPDGGVAPNASNGLLQPEKAPASGTVQYFPDDCGIQITDKWLNCLIQELLCVVNAAAPDVCYDDTKVCNLRDAILALLGDGSPLDICSFPDLPGDLPDDGKVPVCVDGDEFLVPVSEFLNSGNLEDQIMQIVCDNLNLLVEPGGNGLTIGPTGKLFVADNSTPGGP